MLRFLTTKSRYYNHIRILYLDSEVDLDLDHLGLVHVAGVLLLVLVATGAGVHSIIYYNSIIINYQIQVELCLL